MNQYRPVGSRPYTCADSPTRSAPTRRYAAPGPTRQLVGTETLICGIAGVKVKIGVGERVKVGVCVEVEVSVAVDVTIGVMVNAAAVCVSASDTICATMVLIEFSLGPEDRQPDKTINASPIDIIRIGLDLGMAPPFGDKSG